MKKPALLPWEIHPALTEPRLTEIGRLVWAARKGAAEGARWKEGDCLWNIGCTAYVRTRYLIAMATQVTDWLSLASTSPNEGFVFRIGGVPIRFYRGDPQDAAPEKYAYATHNELRSLQAAFAIRDTPTPDAYFRLVVKTDPQGFPFSVTLVQVNAKGEIQNPWRIPVEPTTAMRQIAEAREEAVELPPPPVGDEVTAREVARGNSDDSREGRA